MDANNFPTSKDYTLRICPTMAYDLEAGALLELAGSVLYVKSVKRLANNNVKIVAVFNSKDNRYEFSPSTLLTVLVNPW